MVPFPPLCLLLAAHLLQRIRDLEAELAATRQAAMEQQRAATLALNHAKHLMDDNMAFSSKVSSCVCR